MCCAVLAVLLYIYYFLVFDAQILGAISRRNIKVTTHQIFSIFVICLYIDLLKFQLRPLKKMTNMKLIYLVTWHGIL